MIVEIKITDLNTSAVVVQDFEVVSFEKEAAEWVGLVIEGLGVEMDEDDLGALHDFSLTGHMESRFGDEWQYLVEAVVVSEDEADIDPEFDSIHDKYSFCL